MWLTVLAALWTYLAIGLTGVILINRKRPGPEARSLCVKYAWYVVIVHAVLGAMVLRPHDVWPVAAGLIVVAGAFEIVRLHWMNPTRRLGVLVAGLLLYSVVAVAFIGFAWSVSTGLPVFVYVTVAVFDGFSQISGQLWGRRRLAPVISPAKTLEGVAGGLAAALAAATVVRSVAGFVWSVGLALALGICAAALGGDMLASWYKRQQYAKDYGRLIPGHGGVLDRFDSLLAAGAMCFAAKLAMRDASGLFATALLLGFLTGVLALCERLYRSDRFTAETTRKLAHVGGGIAAFLAAVLGLRLWQFLTVGGLFAVVMVVTGKLNLLRSVHGVARTTLGSCCLPVGLCVCYAAFRALADPVLFWGPALLVTISDPLAAVVGRKWPVGRYRTLDGWKTMAGSVAFLLSAFCILAAVMALWGAAPASVALRLFAALTIGAGVALAEALSPYGLDNLTVPLTGLGLLYLMGGS
jgi:phosphatidate cytidylyltransferase